MHYHNIYIIDAELPALRKVEVANLRKIRALVGILNLIYSTGKISAK